MLQRITKVLQAAYSARAGKEPSNYVLMKHLKNVLFYVSSVEPFDYTRIPKQKVIIVCK